MADAVTVLRQEITKLEQELAKRRNALTMLIGPTAPMKSPAAPQPTPRPTKPAGPSLATRIMTYLTTNKGKLFAPAQLSEALAKTDKGVKRWALRVTVNRRRVERGLGVWPGVNLEEARRKASEARAAAKDGRDLRAEARSGMRQRAVTFEAAFDTFFEIRRQKLSNGKHVVQWESTMRTYVFPLIGRRPVADVTSAEVLAVLQPIWFSKPETASRVLQRMRAVFDSAILRETRERAIPCIGVTMELGTGHRRVKHHPAIPWKDVPAFIRKRGEIQ